MCCRCEGGGIEDFHGAWLHFVFRAVCKIQSKLYVESLPFSKTKEAASHKVKASL